MNNEQLQKAIVETFNLIARTSNEEVKDMLTVHLTRLLHIQQVRAAGNVEEGAPC